MKLLCVLLLLISAAGCRKELIPLQQDSISITSSASARTSRITEYELISFTLKKERTSFDQTSFFRKYVEWKATGEATYLLNYERQYAANGIDYTVIGDPVAPAATDGTAAHRWYISAAGYYRLKINLKDATVQYSNVIRL